MRQIFGFERLESRSLMAVDPFTIAVLPDTQFYSEGYPDTFNAQTQWVLDHRISKIIVFVSQLGDIVQNGESGATRNLTEWQRADAAMDKLDGSLATSPDGLIPYTALIGNHDYVTISDKTSGNSRYNEFFGPSRYQGRSWYLEGSSGVGGHAVLFSAGGYQFLSVTMQFEALDSDIAWVQSIMDLYPAVPTILQTHSYLNPYSKSRQDSIQGNRSGTPNSGNTGEQVFQKLVYPNPQIFLVMNGHFHGEFQQTSKNIANQDVFEMVVDFQSRANGGDGWMRWMEFHPDSNRIDVKTYSPTRNEYETDADSQFSWSFDFASRFGAPWPTGYRESIYQTGRAIDGVVYGGTVDTQLRQAAPTTSYGTNASDLLVDAKDSGGSNESQVLIQFTNLFGTTAGRIPLGSQIQDAELTLDSNNPGAGGKMHRMLASWSNASTWNTMVNGTQANDIEARAGFESQVGSIALTPVVPVDERLQVNVSRDVEAWSLGAANNGWAILPWPGGTDGWAFAPSEASNIDDRPSLTVRWFPPSPGNVRPSVTVDTGVVSYTEDAAPVVLFPNATVVDSDSQTMGGGMLRVLMNEGGSSSDSISIIPDVQGARPVAVLGNDVYVDGQKIGVWGGGGGRSHFTVSLLPNATRDQVQVVLRRVGYKNLSQSPDTRTRVASAMVFDGEGGMSVSAQRGIVVNPVDDPPSVALNQTQFEYSVGGPASSLALRGTLIDVDSSSLVGGKLSISIVENAQSGDRILVRSIGTGVGQVSVVGNEVRYENTSVGTYARTDDTSVLISWNAAATSDIASAVMRAVGFVTTSTRIEPPLRKVRFEAMSASGETVGPEFLSVKQSLVRRWSFQQGVDNGIRYYTSASDTQLSQASPATTNGALQSLFIDYDGGSSNSVGLLRFDSLFGTADGQIPLGARIVSATLNLWTSNGGDGAGFYRMLSDWNPATATWNSIPTTLNSSNRPIRNNNSVARSEYNSQVGTVSGTGDPDSGITIVGVTSDLQAWADGAANLGWLIQGWDSRTDGWAFLSSDATDQSLRPTLEIEWVPNGTMISTFSQGANGYTGVRDTYIRQAFPTSDYSTTPSTLWVDASDPGSNNEQQLLIAFSDIHGATGSKIPFGSTVHAASLTLASVAGDAPGNGGRFHAIKQTWPNPNTWNQWSSGIQANDLEAYGFSSAQAGSSDLKVFVQGGRNNFDVTDDIQNWTWEKTANLGWVVLPWVGGVNGMGIASSESTNLSDRPQLQVYYTAPGVVIQPASTLVTTESGGTTTISFSLKTRPTSDVVLPLVCSDLSEATLSVTQLVFTPTTWDIPQAVVLRGVDDWVRDGDIIYSLMTLPIVSDDVYYRNTNPVDITLVNLDDGIINSNPVLTVSSGSVSANEGESVSNSGTWSDVDIGNQVTLSASVGSVVKNADGTWSWSLLGADDVGATTVTISAADGLGGLATKSFTYSFINQPPVLTVATPIVSGNVLTSLVNAGTWSDVVSDTVVLSSSLGSVVKNIDGTWSWTMVATEAFSNQLVTISASDEDGGVSSVGFLMNSLVSVVNSKVYYRGSSFASNGINDALDPSKSLAKSGTTSRVLSFANVINNSRGINGLVFDVAGLASNHLSAGDFQFRVSPLGAFNESQNPPSSWELGPSPSSIIVDVGTAVSPARIRLEWADNEIANRWLQLKVKANAATGLVVPVVYYIGHLFGETTGALSGGAYLVQVSDVTQIRSAVGSVAPVGSVLDINKNGLVQVSDITAMRSSVGLLALRNITIPAGGTNEEGEATEEIAEVLGPTGPFSTSPTHSVRDCSAHDFDNVFSSFTFLDSLEATVAVGLSLQSDSMKPIERQIESTNQDLLMSYDFDWISVEERIAKRKRMRVSSFGGR
jgi:hypothetical protein